MMRNLAALICLSFLSLASAAQAGVEPAGPSARQVRADRALAKKALQRKATLPKLLSAQKEQFGERKTWQMPSGNKVETLSYYGRDSGVTVRGANYTIESGPLRPNVTGEQMVRQVENRSTGVVTTTSIKAPARPQILSREQSGRNNSYDDLGYTRVTYRDANGKTQKVKLDRRDGTSEEIK